MKCIQGLFGFSITSIFSIAFFKEKKGGVVLTMHQFVDSWQRNSCHWEEQCPVYKALFVFRRSILEDTKRGVKMHKYIPMVALMYAAYLSVPWSILCYLTEGYITPTHVVVSLGPIFLSLSNNYKTHLYERVVWTCCSWGSPLRPTWEQLENINQSKQFILYTVSIYILDCTSWRYYETFFQSQMSMLASWLSVVVVTVVNGKSHIRLQKDRAAYQWQKHCWRCWKLILSLKPKKVGTTQTNIQSMPRMKVKAQDCQWFAWSDQFEWAWIEGMKGWMAKGGARCRDDVSTKKGFSQAFQQISIPLPFQLLNYGGDVIIIPQIEGTLLMYTTAIIFHLITNTNQEKTSTGSTDWKK